MRTHKLVSLAAAALLSLAAVACDDGTEPMDDADEMEEMDDEMEEMDDEEMDDMEESDG